MGLLYKDIQELIYEASIKERKDTEDIEIDFYNDGGKFGAHEMLASFKLTPLRLLEILQDREDITEAELN